ncbi:protein Dok-7 isoform X3 [Leopardus geoffroyi]|uniref:protein Dok-7 isoform X3 n=1 Tax=Leopardus geoffroyi TaxID=46844 RepID=UPI001E2616A9|nr:protein Dok-7 isoform X3 [Leopardus geoffroyi]
MTEAALVEGQVKLRDGKKWKTRWLVLRKPSPVADCLLMLAYKDKSERAKGLRERSSLMLEDICGLEPGLPYEGLAHTLAIVCLSQAVMLGFDSREAMCAWDARIRYALGEVHRFHVTVAPGTKLESGPATLHLCNDVLVVARDIPPAVAGQWKLSDLRRYGAVPSGFIFEGGTRCGYWAGVFFLSSAEGEQISFLFDCIVRGISPTKGPFGLRPLLPDPSPGGTPTAEERVAQEALEALKLEKRLSLLSHVVRPGSGAWALSRGMVLPESRGRPQPVQLVLGGQPLGRQCRQPAHGVARAVLVLGRHVAGGTGAGGRPGPRGGRAGRLEATTQAPAAAAAARGRPPELVGQRHRHGQPLLLLGQLLVLRGQQPGRVARRRRVRVLAQPAARGRGARPQPVRLPAGDGRVPSARCPAATL